MVLPRDRLPPKASPNSSGTVHVVVELKGLQGDHGYRFRVWPELHGCSYVCESASSGRKVAVKGIKGICASGKFPLPNICFLLARASCHLGPSGLRSQERGGEKLRTVCCAAWLKCCELATAISCPKAGLPHQPQTGGAERAQGKVSECLPHEAH